MRQGQQNRRGRGRGGRKSQNPLARNYESNGPDVKIRGTAAHIAEKYMSLARDALSSGDSVGAESYLQHAEHYNRIIMAAQTTQPGGPGNQPNDNANGNYRGRSEDDDSDDNDGSDEEEEQVAAPRNEKPRRNPRRNSDGPRANGADKDGRNNRDSRESRDSHDEQPSSGSKPQEEGASEEALG